MSLPLVVAITGASGVIYGVEMLRVLKGLGQETHLILSEAAGMNLAIETDCSLDEVRSLANVVYQNKDVGAAIASGSFRTRGMIVAPCTIKTLSAIANSFTYNLVVRAADVTLKERRTLVLMVRETPFHKGHLDLMSRAADIGDAGGTRDWEFRSFRRRRQPADFMQVKVGASSAFDAGQ